MKEILTEMEALRDSYTEKAGALINKGEAREANSYLEKAIGVSEAINIIFRSEHLSKFV
jgi:hypothetical protein